MPANDYLCGALAIALCNWRNALVIENASASTTKRAPDLNLNALLKAVINQRLVVEVGIGLNLIDGRHNIRNFSKLLKMMLLEVTYANSADLTLFIQGVSSLPMPQDGDPQANE